MIFVIKYIKIKESKKIILIKQEIKLANERFDTIISLVRRGGSVADIGCDHAYVSCSLVEKGISERVYASDVRKGPLQCAKSNVEKFGFQDHITVRLADGLCGIEDFAPDDIIIAGMGGELIADILSKSEYVKKSGIRLILQPMTCSYELRKYLCENGYIIEKEVLCKDSGRIYECIVCTYCGEKQPYTEGQLYAGFLNDNEELFEEFLLSKINKFKVIINGKETSSLDTSYERKIINELSKRL